MPKSEFKPALVIDATNAILGRLASYVAKQSLLGKKIAVVNCSKAVISGKRRRIIEEYKEIRAKGSAALKGPFFPKHPDKIIKRTIRGMLSYKKGRGKEAFKRIRCYNEIPKELEKAKKIKAGKEKKTKTIKLSDLSSNI